MTIPRVMRYIAVTLALAGFFFSQWVMIFSAVVLALAFGDIAVALVLAVCADFLWGVPTGVLHTVPLPLTFFACICASARLILVRFMRHDVPEIL